MSKVCPVCPLPDWLSSALWREGGGRRGEAEGEERGGVLGSSGIHVVRSWLCYLLLCEQSSPVFETQSLNLQSDGNDYMITLPNAFKNICDI